MNARIVSGQIERHASSSLFGEVQVRPRFSHEINEVARLHLSGEEQVEKNGKEKSLPHFTYESSLKGGWDKGEITEKAVGKGRGLRDFLIICLRKIGLCKGFLTRGEKREALEQEQLTLLSQVIRARPDETSSSSSIIFSYLSKGMGKEDEEMGKQLEQGGKWAKKIESFQKRKTLSPTTKPVQLLVKEIREEIRNLPSLPDKKVLIPGGWQKEDGTFADALYEVSKNESGTFKIRYLSLDESDRPFYAGEHVGRETKYFPILEFNDVKAEDLERALAPLLYIQIPALYRINMSVKERAQLLAASYILEKEGAEDAKQLIDDLLNKPKPTHALTPLEVMHSCFGKQPTVPSDVEKMVKLTKRKTDPAKTLLAYLKIRSPHYEQKKLTLELNTFFNCLNAEGGALLKNAYLRQMAYESARKLLRDVEKRKHVVGMSENTYEAIVCELEAVLEKILEKEKEGGESEVPSILHCDPFRYTCQLPRPLLSDKLLTHENSVQSPQVLEINPLPRPKMEANPAEEQKKMWDAFAAEMDKIRDAYNAGNDRAVEAASIHLALQLPSPDPTGDFWQRIEDKAIIEQWRTSLLELNECLFDSQQIEGARPSAHKIAAQLNLLAIGDRLLVLTAKTDKTLCDAQGHVMTWKIEMSTNLTLHHYIAKNPYFAITSPNAHRVLQSALCYYQHEVNRYQTDSHTGHTPRAVCHLAQWATSDNKDELPEYIRHRAEMENASAEKAYQEIEVEERTILPKAVLQQKKMCLMAQAICFSGIGMGLNGNPYQSALKIANHRLTWQEKVSSWKLFNEPIRLEMDEWMELKNATQRQIQEKWHERLSSKGRDQPRLHTKWKQKIGKKCHNNYFELLPTGVYYHIPDNKFYKNGDSVREHGVYDFGLYASQGEVIEPEISYDVLMHNFHDNKNTYHNLYLRQDLSEEEKALMAIQIDIARVDQAWATYIAHPEWLDRASHRRFFELALFRPTIPPRYDNSEFVPHSLLTVIVRSPQRAIAFLKFAQDQSKSAQEAHLPRAIFFRSLYHRILGCVKESTLVQKDKDEILGQFPDEDLFPSYIGSACTPQEQYMAHTAQLIYLLGPLAETGGGSQALENQELLQRIAISLVHYRSIVISPHERNLAIEGEIEHLLSLVPVYTQLKKACESADKQFVGQLLKGVLPPEVQVKAEQITVTSSYLALENYILDLSSCSLQVNGQVTIPTPPEIMQDGRLMRLLGRHLPQQVNAVSLRDPHTGEQVFKYILNKGGVQVEIFSRVGAPPCIQMAKSDGTRFELLPLVSQEQSAQERPFGEATSLLVDQLVWCELMNPSNLIVSDPAETHPLDPPLYQITFRQEGKRQVLKGVIRCKDHLNLINPWRVNSQLTAMRAIEDSTHLCAWGTANGTLTEVEFPRLKMADGTSLAYKVSDSMLISKQFPGYTTAADTLPLCNIYGKPFLPLSFKSFHFLTNQENDRKVLIPIQPLISQSNRMEMDHCADSLECQPILECSVDTIHEKIEAKSHEGNCFLAYLFFANQHYSQAVEYLEKSQTALSLSPRHRDVYQWINEWPDDTPEGNAFRLKALLALRDNQAKLGEQLGTEIEELQAALQLQELYARYASSSLTIPNLRLTEEEEKIYDRVIAHTHAGGIERQVELYRQKTWQPPIKDAPTYSKEDYEKLYDKMRRHSRLPSPQQLLPTDNSPFLEGFPALYNLFAKQKEDPHYEQWASFVRMARPTTEAACIARDLLREIIRVKEEWGPIPMDEPLPTRQQSDETKEQAVERLSKWFEAYHSFCKMVENDLEKQQSERELIPAWKEKENAPIGTSEMIEALLNPSQEGTRLRAKEIGTAHSVEQWKARKARAQEYLETHPPEKQKGEDADRAFNPSLPVLSFSPFTTSESAEQLPQAQEAKKDTFNALFNPYSEAANGAVDPAVRNLTRHYQKDTCYYLDHQPAEVALQWNEGYDAQTIQQKVVEQRDQIVKERKDEEKMLLTLISLSSRSKAQELLSPTLQSVPSRLIGLYVEGKTDYESLNAALGISLNSDEEAVTIIGLLQSWMIKVIQEQVLQQTLDWMKGYQSAHWETPEMKRALHERLSVQRHFDPASPPHGATLLAIEYQTGFVLRENQVAMIKAMSEDPNCAKQLGMGQGKSSIILPFSLNHAADGTHLAVGIIPEGQYEGVLKELDKGFSQFFGRKIIRFSFDMEQALDLKWLIEYDVRLHEAVEGRQAIITTKQSILGLQNAHNALYKRYDHLINQKIRTPEEEAEKRELFEKLKRLGSMLLLLRERGWAVADEMDSILDVRQELNCEVGTPEAIEKEKWEVGIEVYKTLFTHPELTRYAQQLKANEQAKWNEQDLQCIQDKLYDSLIKEWKIELSPEEALAFKQYVLTTEGEEEPPKMGKLKKSSDPCYNKIACLRHCLQNTLKTAFSSSGCCEYARSPDGIHTLPAKKGVIQHGSKFGEEFEQIAYAIQDYLQNGLNDEQGKQWVEGVFSRAAREAAIHKIKTGKIQSIDETKTGEQFRNKYGVSIQHVCKNPAQLQDVLRRINQDHESILEFLKCDIFPYFTHVPLQVSANAHTFVGMFKHFGGFTGTTSNKTTFARSIHTDKTDTPGTDGKTVVLLREMDSPIILVGNDEDPLNKIADGNYDAVIDVGAYLKNKETKEVINQLMVKKGVRAAVYVTDKGEKVIKSHDHEDTCLLAARPDIKVGERITYYAQKDAIGTHIDQKPDARAALTIGERMYVKDLFQGAWRMRQLGKNKQTVTWIVTEGVKQRILDAVGAEEERNITFDDILLFCIKNQAEGEAEDTLRAEWHRLEGIVPREMVRQIAEALQTAESPEEFDEICKSTFHHYLPHLTRKQGNKIEDLATITKEEETSRVLKDYQLNLAAQYEKVADEIGKTHNPKGVMALRQEIDQLLAQELTEAEKMPKLSPRQNVRGGKGAGVQTQQNQQQQQQQCQQIQVSSHYIPPTAEKNRSLMEWWGPIDTFIDLNKIFGNEEKREHDGFRLIKQEESPFLSTEVKCYMSPNFTPVEEEGIPLLELLSSPQQVQMGQVLVLQFPGRSPRYEFLLLDPREYVVMIKNMKPEDNKQAKGKGRPKMAVYQLNSNEPCTLLLSNQENHQTPWNDIEDQAVRTHLVRLKVMSGQFDFSDLQEIMILQNWIEKEAENNTLSSLREEFEAHLNANKKNEYANNSILYRIFNGEKIVKQEAA